MLSGIFLHAIFCLVYFVRYILSGMFSPGTFCSVYLSGMFCLDIFCLVYFVRVYFFWDNFVRVSFVLVSFVLSPATFMVSKHIYINCYKHMQNNVHAQHDQRLSFPEILAFLTQFLLLSRKKSFFT